MRRKHDSLNWCTAVSMERKTGKDTRENQSKEPLPHKGSQPPGKKTTEKNKGFPRKPLNVVLEPSKELLLGWSVRKGHAVPVEGEYPVLGKSVGFFY